MITYLLVCGLNIVGCSSSIAEKKSTIFFPLRVGFAVDVVSVGADDELIVGTGGGEAGLDDEAAKWVSDQTVVQAESRLPFAFELEVPFLPPVVAFFSAASLFVLYSILFCSKLGSSRYSCRAPASDTGAYKNIDTQYTTTRILPEIHTCFKLGTGTLRRFWSFFATPRYSTTRSVCLQKCR